MMALSYITICFEFKNSFSLGNANKEYRCKLWPGQWCSWCNNSIHTQTKPFNENTSESTLRYVANLTKREIITKLWQQILKWRGYILLQRICIYNRLFSLVNSSSRTVDYKTQPANLGYPVVKFLCGVEKEIMKEQFSLKLSQEVIAIRKQIPLKLAWSISIHKSQVKRI